MGIFDKRVNYKPFEYNHITRKYIDAMWASHWSANEFNFKSDKQDFKVSLTDQEKQVIKRAALLISQIEVAVKSFWGNIGNLIPKPEISDVGAVFSGVEIIHSYAYSKIIDVLGAQNEYVTMISEPIIKGRINYLNKYKLEPYTDNKKNILYSIVLYSLFTENTSLFSQFYVFLGFRRFKNVIKDQANIVAYTMVEEENHAAFGIELFNQIVKEYPELLDYELKNRILHEVNEAYIAESNIIDWMVGDYSSDFLNKTILKEFVKRRLNESIEQLKGFEGLQPFETNSELIGKTDWIYEQLLGGVSTDFFSGKPTEYSKKNKSFNPDDIF